MSGTTPLNFAPYADPPPVLPQYRQQTQASPVASTSASSYQSGAAVGNLGTGTSFSSSGNAVVSGLETTLGYDLARLAALAYALGPLGAAFLLVFEVENDYARFHAYQSALLCGAFLLFDAIAWLLLGSHFMEWLFILMQLVALAWLSRRAYRDADLLDRIYLPGIGRLAEDWVAQE
ncbi:hypothetical protein OIV83_000454 [Microbotryomycetes sp. JL201]|nr:hypothetical protein OIV83_000454 [Microbotryomycetes sp. JL201]